MSDRLPGLPDDCTHAKIAAYFMSLDVSKNHLRVYNAGRMRTTFVGTRWDLDDQSNTLLMAALQPICDRLRYDIHIFRIATQGQLVPQLGTVRWEQLDASPYLLGMPGGTVADLRTENLRKMERVDFITRILRGVAKNQPAPVYDYFFRSISSANDEPADEDWMAHMELLLGYWKDGDCQDHQEHIG